MDIERLNIFATPDELAFIKAQRDMPLIAFTNPEPPGPGVPHAIPIADPIKAAHQAALAHGLPEIPGYYGIDLDNGEFIKAV